MKKIVGLGACVYDTLIECDLYPKEDTKKRAENIIVSGGGPVGNALVVASKLGASTYVIGSFADDDGGKYLLADFVKYGVMHRNSYICAPNYLNNDFSVKGFDNLFIAGQLSGVEGYMESTASGLIAGIALAKKIKGETLAFIPKTTIMGSIVSYLTSSSAEGFQPMNANFGILPPLDEKIRDKALKKQAYSKRAIEDIKKYKETVLC